MVIECQPPVNPDIENQPPFDPNAQTFDSTLPFALDPTQAVNGPYRTTPIPNITAPENLKAVLGVIEAGEAFKTPNELFDGALGELETARDARVVEIDDELFFVNEHWLAQRTDILAGILSGTPPDVDYLIFIQSEIDRLLLIYGTTPFTSSVDFQGDTDASDLGTIPISGPNFLYRIGSIGGSNNFNEAWDIGGNDPFAATFAVGDFIVFDGSIWHKTIVNFPSPPSDDPYNVFYNATYSTPYTNEHPDPGPSPFNNRPGKGTASINIEMRKNQLEFERELLIGSNKDIQRTSADDSFFVVEQTPFMPDQGNLFLGNVQNGLETLRTDLYGPVPSTPVFQPNFYDSPRSIDDFGNFGIGNLLGEGNLVLGHAGAQLRNLPNTLGLLNARSQYNVQTGADDPCGIFGDLLNSLLGDLLSFLADLLQQLLAPLFALLALLAGIINELLALLNMINQLLNLGFAQNLLNLNPCSLPFMSQLGSNQLLNAINLPSRPAAPNLGIPNIGNPF